MTPTEFEKLTQRLLAKRLKQAFGYRIPVEHQKEFRSRSGNKYKVDLSYTFSVCGVNYLTLVECKYWNSYIKREKIGYFKSTLEDLKAQKGIIVTTKGFQKSAVEYAQSQNIGLIKITNDKYFDKYYHFDGAINLLSQSIKRGLVFNPKKRYTSIGLFTPSVKVYNYIKSRYGKELCYYLKNDFDPQTLDDSKIKLSKAVTKQLLDLPEDWYKDYTRVQTAGLGYKMKNEPELRYINMILFLQKWRLQNESK